MIPPHVTVYRQPEPGDTQLVLGFSGWMDGGEVSTGAAEILVERMGASPWASISPRDFYIYNFPGPMELSALFRPHVHIENGLLRHFQEPSNLFYGSPAYPLVVFSGKEPHMRWHEYVESLFAVIGMFHVRQIVFLGSVAGLVPHTREPRITATVSHAHLLDTLNSLKVHTTNYAGPASLINLILLRARKEDIPMICLVAEIPAYIQGKNIKCIETVLRKLSALLNLNLNLEDLRIAGEELEKRIDAIVQQRGTLAEHIKILEENYDKAFFDQEMGDLKQWLIQQGIRLD